MERRRGRGIAGAEELDRPARLPRSRTSKSSAVSPLIGAPLAIGDDHAEVHQIDADAERLLRAAARLDATVIRTAMAA